MEPKYWTKDRFFHSGQTERINFYGTPLCGEGRLSTKQSPVTFKTMETKSFKAIREQYPNDDDYLVLIDCEGRELGSGEYEVVGAKHVQVFKSAREMYAAYKELSKKLPNVYFVPPQYKSSFIMEHRQSMRIGKH